MTKIFRRSKFITFMLVLAVLLSSTAFAFADITVNEDYPNFKMEPLSWVNANSRINITVRDDYNFTADYCPNYYGYGFPWMRLGFKFSGYRPQFSTGTGYLKNTTYFDIWLALRPNFLSSEYILQFPGEVEIVGGLVPFSNRGQDGYRFATNILDDPNSYAVVKFTVSGNGSNNNILQNLCVYDYGNSSSVVTTSIDYKLCKVIQHANNQYEQYETVMLDGGLPNTNVVYIERSFLVPSGKMLRLLADNIQSINVTLNKSGLLQGSSFTQNAHRYNYAVDVNTALDRTAFGNSNIIPWSRVSSGIWRNSYSFEVPHDNSNAVNFYNFNYTDDTPLEYTVTIKASTFKAWLYSQNVNGQIVLSSSSEGAIYNAGGTGSDGSPIISQLYDESGTQLYKPSVSGTVGGSGSASDNNNFVDDVANALNTPLHFMQTIKDSTGNFMQTISTMFSWLPVELTSVIVGSFSIIIAVGVLKMFL